MCYLAFYSPPAQDRGFSSYLVFDHIIQANGLSNVPVVLLLLLIPFADHL